MVACTGLSNRSSSSIATGHRLGWARRDANSAGLDSSVRAPLAMRSVSAALASAYPVITQAGTAVGRTMWCSGP